MTRDPWALLGVSASATDEEIKSAYRSQAKLYHPDRNPGDARAAAMFQDLADAYKSIKDTPARAQTGPSPIINNDQLNKIEKNLQINFRQSYEGSQVDLEIEVVDVCAVCGGSGAALGDRPAPCAQCSGSGEYQTGPIKQSCRDCGGRGFIIVNPCPSCKGGLSRQKRNVTVQIPAGIPNNHRLRISGPQTRSGNGEIILTVNVLPSAVYSRTFADTNDLLIEVPISYTEACFGASVKIPTPERVIALKVPPGTPSGKAFRIAGQGMPKFNAPGKGDLFARVQIVVPEKISSAQRRLIEQLSDQDDDHLRGGLFRHAGE
jgi:molecular chaperone DnaJ